MATVRRNQSDTMTLKVITSVDAGGTATLANVTVSKLNPELTDDDTRLLGVDLAGLQAHELDHVERTLKYELAAQ